ncbi:hypothetical protein D3C74_454440 [compost metagenome]
MLNTNLVKQHVNKNFDPELIQFTTNFISLIESGQLDYKDEEGNALPETEEQVLDSSLVIKHLGDQCDDTNSELDRFLQDFLILIEFGQFDCEDEDDLELQDLEDEF